MSTAEMVGWRGFGSIRLQLTTWQVRVRFETTSTWAVSMLCDVAHPILTVAIFIPIYLFAVVKFWGRPPLGPLPDARLLV